MSEKIEYKCPYPILLSDIKRHIKAASELLKTPIDLLEIAPSETYLIIRKRSILK